MISFLSDLVIIQFLKLIINNINLFSTNFKIKNNNDFILFKNLFLYLTTSFHLYLLKNIYFYIFFYLYFK